MTSRVLRILRDEEHAVKHTRIALVRWSDGETDTQQGVFGASTAGDKEQAVCQTPPNSCQDAYIGCCGAAMMFSQALQKGQGSLTRSCALGQQGRASHGLHGHSLRWALNDWCHMVNMAWPVT